MFDAKKYTNLFTILFVTPSDDEGERTPEKKIRDEEERENSVSSTIYYVFHDNLASVNKLYEFLNL